jgi:hypothetical protein
VYLDSSKTSGLGLDSAIAISMLHNGSTYADDLSADGVIYHYPATQRPGRDAAEIAGLRAAYATAMPVFVITTGTTQATRTVYRGYIEEDDDLARLCLITFSNDELPPPPPAEEESPFSLVGEQASETYGKRRSRPNQQRFAFQVESAMGLVARSARSPCQHWSARRTFGRRRTTGAMTLGMAFRSVPTTTSDSTAFCGQSSARQWHSGLGAMARRPPSSA